MWKKFQLVMSHTVGRKQHVFMHAQGDFTQAAVRPLQELGSRLWQYFTCFLCNSSTETETETLTCLCLRLWRRILQCVFKIKSRSLNLLFLTSLISVHMS